MPQVNSKIIPFHPPIKHDIPRFQNRTELREFEVAARHNIRGQYQLAFFYEQPELDGENSPYRLHYPARAKEILWNISHKRPSKQEPDLNIIIANCALKLAWISQEENGIESITKSLIETAQNILQKHSIPDDGEAEFLLGWMFHHKLILSENNLPDHISLYKAAAQRGNLDALTALRQIAKESKNYKLQSEIKEIYTDIINKPQCTILRNPQAEILAANERGQQPPSTL